MEEIRNEVNESEPIELILDEVKEDSHKLIVAIVKKGFAYEVIRVASGSGGKGAIILGGRGSSQDKKRLFGLEIAPEKEMVLMVVKEALVYPIIKEIYAISGFKTNAKGTVFALPISKLLD